MTKRQAPKNVFNASWLFGHPVARAANNSTAKWVKPTASPLYQKGGGWMIELVGGVQTNDDWAACYIPTNEYPITLFTEAQWSYYMNATESMGVNIVFWIHDPDDFDKRAEITQLGGHADLEKSAGWNAFEFKTSTGGMFFYGENTSGTLLTAGTQYTWSQFQSDNLFKTWVIYRISLEYGWEASGSFDKAYLAEVKLNEVPVPLIPPQLDALDEITVAKSIFGEPVLRAGGSGAAAWEQNPSYTQKGTGWQAKLTGGAQSGDDWGSIYFPVNEMLVSDFDDANWSWYQLASAAYGVNIVIWVHDPNNYDNRAEITQSGSATSLDKGSGWNSHEFPSGRAEYFWYGENVSGSGISEGAGTLSTWATYQADAIFASWRIYRVSLDFGWYSTGTFTDVWVTEFGVNGEQIPIRPGATELLSSNPVKQIVTSKAIDASIGAYAVYDVVNDDDCSTTATAWTFSDMVAKSGGLGSIIGATVFNETEGVTPRLTLRLYNASPSSQLTDNSLSTQAVADRLLYLGQIDFPAMESLCTTTDASTTLASPSTVGNLPLSFKCAAGVVDLYGILLTRDAFTQTATDDITIVLLVEQH